MIIKTLETERLILRKFEKEDFAAVHSYASRAENVIYMPWGPNSADETQAYINIAITKAEENPCIDYHYAAVKKDTGGLIGGCGISVDNTASLGWILHRDYWRQGFGTEMAEALLQFGFEELKLHRITALCDVENIGSYRVMEKIGMRREGLFLEARPPNKQSDKKYGDELVYAILKDEWEAQRENAYYNTLPCEFSDFIDVPELSDGVIYLVCTAKHPANPEKKYVPGYDFAICKGGEKVGEINLRIGYGGGEKNGNLYFGGQIGYNIDEKHRGNGYAARACRLLKPVAKSHKMTKLLMATSINPI